MWRQKQIRLTARPRGFHLVTDEIVNQLELSDISVGVLHLFIQHTSASLTLNENASADVRRDFERYVREVVPDETAYFEHTYEGADDMPAHIKASFFGAALSIPIQSGRLALGTWQGIYLGEHRERGGQRKVMATIWGETR